MDEYEVRDQAAYEWIDRHPDDASGAAKLLAFCDDLHHPLSVEGVPVPGSQHKGYVTKNVPDTDIWVVWCTDTRHQIVYLTRVVLLQEGVDF